MVSCFVAVTRSLLVPTVTVGPSWHGTGLSALD